MIHKKGFYEKYIKCPMDFFFALIALAVFSPVMLVVAILVRVKLGAPVIFKQERPGKNGKIFTLYKFRTMTDARDENGELLPDSDRLTRFGRFLRSTSLDELPSLINILCFKMSFVGPRPLLVQYLPRYNEHQARRHEVKPGFTGYAQVNGRNAISWEEKFDYDETLKLPTHSKKGSGTYTPPSESDEFENFDPDPLKSIVETPIGNDGMRIDRMYFNKFEETVKEDPVAREYYEQGNFAATIHHIDDHIMNRPNEYYTWERVRRSIGSDRHITIREIIDKIFGVLPFFKSKQELVEDEFEGYILTHSIPQERFSDIKEFFATYVTDKDVRRAIEDRKFQLLGTDISTYTMADLKRLGYDNMQSVVDYVADNVNVSRFM